MATQLKMTTDYTIRLMLYLYAQRNAQISTAREISEATNIPVKYIDSLARRLRKAGLIYSSRGTFGGYHIVGDGSHISLYDVMQLVEPEKIHHSMEENGSSEGRYGYGAVCRFYEIRQEVWEQCLKAMTLKLLAEDPDSGTLRRVLTEAHRGKEKHAEHAQSHPAAEHAKRGDA